MDHRARCFEHQLLCRGHELDLHRHLRAGYGVVRELSDRHDSGFKHVRRRVGLESYGPGAIKRGKKGTPIFQLSRPQGQMDSVQFFRSWQECWLTEGLVLWPQAGLRLVDTILPYLDHSLRSGAKHSDLGHCALS